MTLPANIRVNTRVPFPSLVTGAGPITISKQNGIWTVGLQFQVLGTQTPPATSFPNDYIIVWDSVLNTYFKMPLSSVLSGGGQTARLPPANASVPILTSDLEIGIDTVTAPTSCPLPSVAAWVGASFPNIELCIFDYTGHGFTNHITPALNGTDTFVQGIVPVIQNNFGSLMLRPIITGGPVNSWFVRHLQ
jgi:hypothetical protein